MGFLETLTRFSVAVSDNDFREKTQYFHTDKPQKRDIFEGEKIVVF